MNTGKIELKREKETFWAGFCIIKKELPDLIKDILILHPNEKAYYDHLKVDKRKESYLLGRLAAKKAICELIEEKNIQSISIDFGVFQFPVVKYVASQPIQVSITHCDHIGIALAFSESHPLGIDIEKVDVRKIDAMKSQIGEKELDLIAGKSPSSAADCTIIWTIKEGLSKILRTGLTMDFKMLEIGSCTKEGFIYTSTFRHYAQYKALSCHAGNYVCSIIVPKNTVADIDFFWNMLQIVVSE